jgi:hypothetical protein
MPPTAEVLAAFLRLAAVVAAALARPMSPTAAVALFPVVAHFFTELALPTLPEGRRPQLLKAV